VSGTQLRRYEIKQNEMEEFLEEWQGLATIRRRYGFSILCALVDEDASEFVWIVRHPDDFVEAERTYYADPERDILGAKAGRHVVSAHVSMVREVGQRGQAPD
jgi:hypothetical protein